MQCYRVLSDHDSFKFIAPYLQDLVAKSPGIIADYVVDEDNIIYHLFWCLSIMKQYNIRRKTCYIS